MKMETFDYSLPVSLGNEKLIIYWNINEDISTVVDRFKSQNKNLSELNLSQLINFFLKSPLPHYPKKNKKIFVERNSQELKDISYYYNNFINKLSNNIDEKSIEFASNILKKNGILIIKNTNFNEIIDNINNAFKKYDDKIYKLIDNKEIKVDLSIQDIETGLCIEGRSKNRIEVKCPLEEPFINSSIINNPIIIQILNNVMEEKMLEIDTLSLVRSKNNIEPQEWHADITPTNQIFQQINKIAMPPDGIVMIIALNDITLDLGPTEFLPGSHFWNTSRNNYVNLDNKDIIGYLPTTVKKHCCPLLYKGDIILFDIRLYHRGGVNKTDTNRDIMYISYLKKWYSDRVNFQEKNSKNFEKIKDEDKNLLSRIDTNNYTKLLEKILIDNNIDLPIMKKKKRNF